MNETLPRAYCRICLKSQSSCLCHLMRPFTTQVKFIILIHPKERRWRSGTGTGRITHLCISNSDLLEGVDFSHETRMEEYLNKKNYFPVVLFPSTDAINISSQKEILKDLNTENKQLLVFVIDGSWPCAKTMVKANPKLMSLPKIAFTPTVKSGYQFKKQPHDYCLSTIEAVHTVISLLENKNPLHQENPQDNLIDVFTELVNFQKSFSGKNPRIDVRKHPHLANKLK